MDTSTIVSIASACFAASAVAVSYYTYIRSLKASSRPVLVFSRRSETLWLLENVGSGPALSLVVGESMDHKEWINITYCDPLSAGASISLPWLKRSMALGVVYTDIHGDTFTTHCAGRNVVTKGNKFPQWTSDSHEWLQRLLVKGATLFDESELENCSAFELDVKRNKIYARHGYIFTRTRPDLAAHFEKQDWYAGSTDDSSHVENQLSYDEKAAARFLRHFQVKSGLMTPKVDRSSQGGDSENRKHPSLDQ